MQRVLIGLLLIFTTLNVKATHEGLMIGPAILTIGMDQAKAWSLLKRFSVQCLDSEKTVRPPTCNSWIVTLEKLGRHIVLGNVSFKDGRLIKIYKYHDSDEWLENPQKFVSLLYEVLRQYEMDGHIFDISIDETLRPGAVIRTIFFRSGKRLIVVDSYEGSIFQKDGMTPSASLHEELHEDLE